MTVTINHRLVCTVDNSYNQPQTEMYSVRPLQSTTDWYVQWTTVTINHRLICTADNSNNQPQTGMYSGQQLQSTTD
ncbi:hypothetical protein DPMN_097400 [Dreissena polymorpha]|uniref:Uncharacterized protein n=1 Tax=Dreissena polymorpha TaxID=45954 RepID=A0A9D4LA72_DREPO|nr:hypothetical protein DPMN_097400 [Dreissena polymorpha]